MLADKVIVREMRILRQDAIDFLHLPRTQILMRIEAPAPGEQALTSQDLVDAGDAARELVHRIEQRRVGVGQLRTERQQLKDLQREVFELKRANEILRKASAYFAQAELDRRPK